MKFLIRAFVLWLPLAVAITGICLLVYATVQQNYRQSLNDPQIQMAEDGVAALESGAVPASLVQRGTAMIDIAKSLAPWLVVYDASGTPLESSAVLNGKPPVPPVGTFEYVGSYGVYGTPGEMNSYRFVPAGEDRLTWQPQSDVRQAIVVALVRSGPSKGYFVVVGRNMREVENREGQLETFVCLAWFVLVVATFIAMLFSSYFNNKIA
jgi:energy-converting hydrogenase Eha subunit F